MDESLPFHLDRIAQDATTFKPAYRDYEAANPWLMLLRRIGYQILSEFSRKYNAK